MLRLRAYEKLQNFVQAGIVKKDKKEYTGVKKALAAFFKTAAEFNARFASGDHCRPPLKPGVVHNKLISQMPASVLKPALPATGRGRAKAAKAKLPVQKVRTASGKSGPKGRKAMAQAR